MNFRLVPKWMTLNNLNGVMVVTLRYFTEFGKPAFEHITATARIEVIDRRSASMTDRAVKFSCITKDNDFSLTYF